jgi:hypothetical protein
MTSRIIKCSVQQLATFALEAEYGKGKVVAGHNGYIKFLFDEVHEGCNEIQVGTWAFFKDRITFNLSLTYEEALEHMRNKTKPKLVNPIHITFQSIK